MKKKPHYRRELVLFSLEAFAIVCYTDYNIGTERKINMADNNKSRSRGRRRFLDDYQKVGDEYVYVGDYFVFSGTAAEKKRFHTLTITQSVVCMAIFIALGFFATGGMRRYYVLLPYTAAICAAAFCIFDSIKICVAGDEINREQYERGANRLPKAAIVLAAASCVCALGEVVYLLFDRLNFMLRNDIFFLVDVLLASAIAILLARETHKSKWEKKSEQ